MGENAGNRLPSKSDEFLDSLNTLSSVIQEHGERLGEFVEALDAVMQQFSVIITNEAEKRGLSVEEFVGGSLLNLFGRKKA